MAQGAWSHGGRHRALKGLNKATDDAAYDGLARVIAARQLSFKDIGMVENPSRLTVADVNALIERGEPVAFIDSRNPIAWGSSKVKLPGALRIPIDEVN